MKCLGQQQYGNIVAMLRYFQFQFELVLRNIVGKGNTATLELWENRENGQKQENMSNN